MGGNKGKPQLPHSGTCGRTSLTSDFPALPTSDNLLVLLRPTPKAKSLHKAQILTNNKNKAMEHRRKNPVGCYSFHNTLQHPGSPWL